MRVILILTLLPIAVAAARAEDPARPGLAPPPPSATVAVSVPSPIAPAPISVTSAPQTTEIQSAGLPVPPNVSLPTTNVSQTTASGAAPEQPAAPDPGHHKRMTMEEHFAVANTTHDGHLTMDEAKTGYRSLVRHFQDIDATHKGYVTVEDIQTWRSQQRAARNGTHSGEGTLHPRPAYQPGMSAEHRSFNTSTSETVRRAPDQNEGSAAMPPAQ